MELLPRVDWKAFFRNLYDKITKTDVFNHSAQVAFYFSFAFFPLLLFLVSLFGLVLSSTEGLRAELYQYLAQIMPSTAFDLVHKTMDEIIQTSSSGKLTLGLLVTLWSASAGVDRDGEASVVADEAALSYSDVPFHPVAGDRPCGSDCRLAAARNDRRYVWLSDCFDMGAGSASMGGDLSRNGFRHCGRLQLAAEFQGIQMGLDQSWGDRRDHSVDSFDQRIQDISSVFQFVQ